MHRIEIHDTVLSILKLITKETSHSSTNELRLTRCIYWILEHFCRRYWCVLIAFCLWMYLCVVIFRRSPFSSFPYNRWANNQYTFRLAVWIKTKPFFSNKNKRFTMFDMENERTHKYTSNDETSQCVEINSSQIDNFCQHSYDSLLFVVVTKSLEFSSFCTLFFKSNIWAVANWCT